jgi:hypothetical protein
MSKPRTRKDLDNLRKQGSLVGYFGKLPKGRPPKDAKCGPNRPNKKNQPTSVAAIPPVATKPANKKRGSYTKWADPHNREALRAAMKDPTEENKKHQAEPHVTTNPAKKKRGSYMKRADPHNVEILHALGIAEAPDSRIHNTFSEAASIGSTEERERQK